VNTHDFPDKEKGKVVPYGVYDIGHNEAGLIRLMRARCEVLGCGASTSCSEVGTLGKCYW
jgi:hypothetical protein